MTKWLSLRAILLCLAALVQCPLIASVAGKVRRRTYAWRAETCSAGEEVPLQHVKPPQFLLVSCPKCGSTALYYGICRASQQINCRANKAKETNFLRKNAAADYPSAKAFYAAYVRAGFTFPPPSYKQIHGGQTVGESPVVYEASIWYYLDRRSARGVHAILPCSKLLWIFRNPLPRARSHYYHIHGADQSKILVPGAGVKRAFTLGELLEPEADAILRCNRLAGVDNADGFDSPFLKCMAQLEPHLRTRNGVLRLTYLQTGLYHFYVQAWRKLSPRRPMHFIDYEDIKSRPSTTIASVLKFLNISDKDTGLPRHDGTEAPLKEAHHLGWNTVKLRRQHRELSHVPGRVLAKLKAALTPHVKALYTLVGRTYRWNLNALGEL
mmetsp:Transcript_37023/g.94623  ORF Transcript_37023/g.94623 Transcript_37023/m.94623 type:complete len:382 (+) Transcript_37023:186-1331(+)